MDKCSACKHGHMCVVLDGVADVGGNIVKLVSWQDGCSMFERKVYMPKDEFAILGGVKNDNDCL